MGDRLRFPGKPSALYQSIKSLLLAGYDDDHLATAPTQIQKLLQLHEAKEEAVLFCGQASPKNFKRDPSKPHVRRADGAWFDFGLTLRHTVEGWEVCAYDYEIRFPPVDGLTGPEFLRFDLNPPGHPNIVRSHLHVGTDDDGMAVPSPAFLPAEMVDLLIYGLRREDRIRSATRSEASP
jgi:hypothetical protein